MVANSRPAEERFEQRFVLSVGERFAGIADSNVQLPFVQHQLHQDGLRPVSVELRVLEQVAKGQSAPTLDRIDHEAPITAKLSHLDLGVVTGKSFQGVIDDHLCQQRLGIRAVMVQVRELEHVLHDALHTAAGEQELLGRFGAGLIGGPGVTLEERRHARDNGQRGPQLVRNQRQQFISEAARLAERGDILEHTKGAC